MRARRLSCILRGSALRAERLRMRSISIVLAMRRIRVVVTNGKNPAPRRNEKGRRSAEKRMPSTVRPLLLFPPPLWGRVGRGVGSGPDGDRSPSGAPPRRLPRRANARTQPRPRFTRNTMRRRYLRLESRLSKAPCAPVVMPEGTMPGPPGSEGDEPSLAGTASRSVSRRHRLTSLNEERDGARLLSSARQSQRV